MPSLGARVKHLHRTQQTSGSGETDASATDDVHVVPAHRTTRTFQQLPFFHDPCRLPEHLLIFHGSLVQQGDNRLARHNILPPRGFVRGSPNPRQSSSQWATWLFGVLTESSCGRKNHISVMTHTCWQKVVYPPVCSEQRQDARAAPEKSRTNPKGILVGQVVL